MSYEQQTAAYEQAIRDYHANATFGGFSGITEAIRLRDENAALKAEVSNLKRRRDDAVDLPTTEER